MLHVDRNFGSTRGSIGRGTSHRIGLDSGPTCISPTQSKIKSLSSPSMISSCRPWAICAIAPLTITIIPVCLKSACTRGSHVIMADEWVVSLLSFYLGHQRAHSPSRSINLSHFPIQIVLQDF